MAASSTVDVRAPPESVPVTRPAICSAVHEVGGAHRQPLGRPLGAQGVGEDPQHRGAGLGVVGGVGVDLV